jgi:hypothetical protein
MPFEEGEIFLAKQHAFSSTDTAVYRKKPDQLWSDRIDQCDNGRVGREKGQQK